VVLKALNFWKGVLQYFENKKSFEACSINVCLTVCLLKQEEFEKKKGTFEQFQGFQSVYEEELKNCLFFAANFHHE
jgi:hypothetical protein